MAQKSPNAVYAIQIHWVFILGLVVSLYACGGGNTDGFVAPQPTDSGLMVDGADVGNAVKDENTITDQESEGDAPVADVADVADAEDADQTKDKDKPLIIRNGRWGEIIEWPHIPVHMANLPDGRLVSWSAFLAEGFVPTSGNYTVSAVFNPITGEFFDSNNSAHDMFCAGVTLLEDGTVLATGGNSTVRYSSRFNLDTLQWESTAPMNSPRWYGTNVTLGNGKVFSTFAQGAEEFGEMYDPVTDSWVNLPGTDMRTLSVEQAGVNARSNDMGTGQWYAYMHVTPDGKVYHPGPTETMHLFTTEGQGDVEQLGPTPLDRKHIQYGTSTNFSPGKLLVTGGEDLTYIPNGATNEAMIVDLTTAKPTARKIDSMHRTRAFHNAVVMANGEIIIIGGNGNGILFNDEDTRLDSEIFNPDTETWRLAQPISVPRNYHSVALLMKDARVISAGGGLCGEGCYVNHLDAQIYTPGYLLNQDGSLADRPEITELPDAANPGEDIQLQTDHEVSRFTMIRLAGTTHGINTDQRFMDIEFSANDNGSGYTLNLEDNPNILIPGIYWVFALNSEGVPSVGAILKIKVLEQ